MMFSAASASTLPLFVSRPKLAARYGVDCLRHTGLKTAGWLLHPGGGEAMRKFRLIDDEE